MLCWLHHLLFYLRHCPSPNHLSSGSWQSACKKLTGVQSLDEQNWFAYNLFVKRSGRGWSDFNFRAEVASLSFCQAISSTGWAWMLWLKVPRGPGMDAAGACSASSKFAHASLLLSLWFILVEFSAQQLAMWLWEGTVPCAQWSKDRPGSQAMCKGFGQGPRRRQRSPVRVVASDSGSLLRSQHVISVTSGDSTILLCWLWRRGPGRAYHLPESTLEEVLVMFTHGHSYPWTTLAAQ